MPASIRLTGWNEITGCEKYNTKISIIKTEGMNVWRTYSDLANSIQKSTTNIFNKKGVQLSGGYFVISRWSKGFRRSTVSTTGWPHYRNISNDIMPTKTKAKLNKLPSFFQRWHTSVRLGHWRQNSSLWGALTKAVLSLLSVRPRKTLKKYVDMETIVESAPILHTT